MSHSEKFQDGSVSVSVLLTKKQKESIVMSSLLNIITSSYNLLTLDNVSFLDTKKWEGMTARVVCDTPAHGKQRENELDV